ncbi:chemotaxis protein CheW [Roseateles sp. BYS78W]|uniref:Chemotaxis protein CheW n=1 Tax=Pelomonas candidula TaxID=3299025 RepID=A0ABW7H5I1_9BURK
MNELTVATEPTAALAEPAEYLSFRLGDEEYGIGILQVQEIRSYEEPTKIANAPAVLRGVIDLRGVITPIVDLRLAFNQPAPCTGLTGVIVLNLGGRVVGIVVDAVSDVVELGAEQIRPAPRLSAPGFDTSFVTGIATLQQRLLILMDIARLLDNPALGLAGAMPSAA